MPKLIVLERFRNENLPTFFSQIFALFRALFFCVLDLWFSSPVSTFSIISSGTLTPLPPPPTTPEPPPPPRYQFESRYIIITIILYIFIIFIYFYLFIYLFIYFIYLFYLFLFGSEIREKNYWPILNSLDVKHPEINY